MTTEARIVIWSHIGSWKSAKDSIGAGAVEEERLSSD
jgi:hypothetical protein